MRRRESARLRSELDRKKRHGLQDDKRVRAPPVLPSFGTRQPASGEVARVGQGQRAQQQGPPESQSDPFRPSQTAADLKASIREMRRYIDSESASSGEAARDAVIAAQASSPAQAVLALARHTSRLAAAEAAAEAEAGAAAGIAGVTDPTPALLVAAAAASRASSLLAPSSTSTSTSSASGGDAA